MKYYLLSNSCVVCIGDKTYTVSSDDYRYSKVKDNLESGNYDSVAQLIDPTYNLNKEGFVVREGLVYYQNSAIPSVLGNRFMQYQQNSWEFRSIFNFWHNLKNRLDRQEASDVVQELISRDAYAITEDGFYFVYNNNSADISQNVLNKKKGNVFHFYNYSTVPNNYFELFRQKQSLDQILENSFGFCSKKLKSLAIRNLFQEENNYINYRFFFFGEALRNILNRDNVLFAIENNLIDPKFGDFGSYVNLSQFLKDYSIDKNGEYSQKKVLNFLKGATDKQHLVDVGIYYSQLKETLNLDIQNIEFSNNCEMIYEYLKEEIKKVECPKFDLHNDTIILDLQDAVVGDFRILVPMTNYDLIEWGNIMQNCIGTYGQKVRSKECQVIAIMNNKTNEMLYNIDIQKRQIIQFSTRGNAEPKKLEYKEIVDFLKDKGLVTKE